MTTSDLMNGEFNVISNCINDNNIVFDVGAYVGEWSYEALKTNKKIEIHQFEPSKISFNKLVENFKTIKSKIVQNNILISNYIGESDFYYYPKIPTLSTRHKRNTTIENKLHISPEKTSILTTTLDCYCSNSNIQKIDFLKIDTEGCEFEVIKSASNLLKNNKIKHIQFEYGGCFKDSNITLKEVYEFLHNHNFSIFKILDCGLLKIEKFSDDLEKYDYSNYLAILNTEI